MRGVFSCVHFKKKGDDMKWYIRTIKSDFARYGFVTCPLSDSELERLYRANIKVDEVYGIGCDVNAGIAFEKAVYVNCEKEI